MPGLSRYPIAFFMPTEKRDEDADGVPGKQAEQPPERPQCEIGGPKGPEPTRYGDWEKKGRCIDF